MFTFYKLLQTLALIPICNVNLIILILENGIQVIQRDSELIRNEVLETELPDIQDSEDWNYNIH